MPKLKTNRAAAKRFKVTASGKILCNHSCKRHILTKKDRKRKRHLRAVALVSKADLGRVRDMLLI